MGQSASFSFHSICNGTQSLHICWSGSLNETTSFLSLSWEINLDTNSLRCRQRPLQKVLWFCLRKKCPFLRRALHVVLCVEFRFCVSSEFSDSALFQSRLRNLYGVSFIQITLWTQLDCLCSGWHGKTSVIEFSCQSAACGGRSASEGTSTQCGLIQLHPARRTRRHPNALEMNLFITYGFKHHMAHQQKK